MKGRFLTRGGAEERKRRPVRRLAWLAVLLVLSLAFMPAGLPGPAAAPAPHHHPGHHRQADAGGAAHHPASHHPGGEAPKGCDHRGGCPFCTAHPGFSPPPPQMAALPLPAGFTVAPEPPAATIEPAPPHFLSSLRPRAPPAAAA